TRCGGWSGPENRDSIPYAWRAPDHNTGAAPMFHHQWIEQLNFAVEVFDEGGNLLEVLARLHDLDAARAAHGAGRLKYPAKLIMLCQGGRILHRSDRDEPGMRRQV